MNLLSYFSVLVLGFTGSLHCVGMCGPLQTMLSKAQWLNKLLYHYGRYMSYSLIGILFYYLSFATQLMAMQKYLTVLSGIVMLGLVVFPYFKIPFAGNKLTLGIMAFARNQSSEFKFFLMGTANGLLPCGLVYVAASQSIVANNIWQSLLLMFLFLLGTLPALLGLNVIYTVLDGSKFFFNKLKPIIMVSMGVLLIVRGLTPMHQPNTPGNAVVVCK